MIAPVCGSACRLVPPQASACGLDAGKSQCGWPSLTASPLPLSPDATHTVMPIAAASAMAASRLVRACAVQESSDSPQLMLIAVGTGVAWTAAVTAATKPWSLLGAKYTSWAAPGATEPTTSMSSRTSPSAPDGSWPATFLPPATLTAVIDGGVMPRPEK